MGEIRKRGGVYWIRYYRNGRRHEESAHTDKHETASTLLKLREGKIAAGGVVTAKMGRLRFEDAAADLRANYTANKRRSLPNVERHLARLAVHFGGGRVAEITTADIEQYQATRRTAGASTGTINREVSALRRLLRLAKRAGKLLDVPIVPMLQERNARKGFFEREQFDAVLAHLSPVLQAVATVAYYTGWRVPSEILPLDWRRVDRKAAVIRLDVNETKNDDGREFHYGALTEVSAMIEAQWAAHDVLCKAGTICPFVFQRFGGKRIKSFRKAWITACAEAGVPGRIPHDFRRTAVRNLERAGVSRSVGMKVTGHKTENVYRRYAIVSSGDLAEAGQKLQALAMGTKTGTIGRSDESSDSQKASA